MRERKGEEEAEGWVDAEVRVEVDGLTSRDLSSPTPVTIDVPPHVLVSRDEVSKYRNSLKIYNFYSLTNHNFFFFFFSHAQESQKLMVANIINKTFHFPFLGHLSTNQYARIFLPRGEKNDEATKNWVKKISLKDRSVECRKKCKKKNYSLSPPNRHTGTGNIASRKGGRGNERVGG